MKGKKARFSLSRRRLAMAGEKRGRKSKRFERSVAGVVATRGDGNMPGASLEQLVSIFDAIDEHICVADPDSYEVLYANEAVKRLFGEDVVGTKCHKMMQDLDEPCGFCPNHLVFGENLGKTHSWEFKNRKLNKWLKCIDRAIPWSGGRMAHFEMAIDIHERKMAEKAVQESEKKYRQLIENIHEVIYSTDEKGMMTYVSPAIQAITGFSPSEIEGRHFSQFIFEDDFDRIVGRFGGALLGQEKPTEYRLVTKAGKPVWVSTFSKPIFEGDAIKGLQGVLSDISEKKAAEKALVESERRYRELLGAMNEGFRMLDEKGRIRYVNEKLCSMLGYEAHEMIGRSVGEFLDADNRKIWEKEFEKRAEGFFESYEIAHAKKDGGIINTLVSPKPIFDENGRFNGSFSVITDITKLKNVESALQARQRELSVKGAHLEEMNAALRVILERRDRDKKELEERILFNIKEQVIPYLEKLRRLLQDEKQKTYLDIVETHIRSITSSFSRDLHVKYLNLTHTELYISGLIRDGKTTGEIAALMNLSARTVESHRKHIRRKMGLIDMKANLRTTLISLG
jgi:PAS domain S-box-containing protein